MDQLALTFPVRSVKKFIVFIENYSDYECYRNNDTKKIKTKLG